MLLFDQVGLSILKILLQVTRPKTVMLGNIPGTDIYRNVDHYEEAVKLPGFLILSIEAPINFANITYLNERLGYNFHTMSILSMTEWSYPLLLNHWLLFYSGSYDG